MPNTQDTQHVPSDTAPSGRWNTAPATALRDLTAERGKTREDIRAALSWYSDDEFAKGWADPGSLNVGDLPALAQVLDLDVSALWTALFTR